MARDESPLPGRSTLSTPAPMSARIIVQKGPAMWSVRSSTSSPCSGPLVLSVAITPPWSARGVSGRPPFSSVDCRLQCGMREYRYTVDREGRVFHDGSEIVDPLVLRFFIMAMSRTPEGRYLVVCQGEQNWFDADGTPFVVQRLRPVLRDGAVAGLELGFAGGYH